MLYGCRQVRSASPLPATNASFAARPSRHVHKLHVHRGDVGIAGSLRVDEQLLHHAGQELNACLPLPRGDEGCAADLVEHRRGTLLVRRIDDVRLQRVDGGQLMLPSIEAKLTRIVGRRDGRRIGHVQGGEPRRHDAAGGWRQPRQQIPRIHDGMTHSEEGGARWVAKDQGVVVRLREQEVAAVRPPARRVLQRVLREIGEQAQTLRHPP